MAALRTEADVIEALSSCAYFSGVKALINHNKDIPKKITFISPVAAYQPQCFTAIKKWKPLSEFQMKRDWLGDSLVKIGKIRVLELNPKAINTIIENLDKYEHLFNSSTFVYVYFKNQAPFHLWRLLELLKLRGSRSFIQRKTKWIMNNSNPISAETLIGHSIGFINSPPDSQVTRGIVQFVIDNISTLKDLSLPNVKRLQLKFKQPDHFGQPPQFVNVKIPGIIDLRVHYHKTLPRFENIVIGPLGNKEQKRSFELSDTRCLTYNSGAKSFYSRTGTNDHVEPIDWKFTRHFHCIFYNGVPDIVVQNTDYSSASCLSWRRSVEFGDHEKLNIYSKDSMIKPPPLVLPAQMKSIYIENDLPDFLVPVLGEVKKLESMTIIDAVGGSSFTAVANPNNRHIGPFQYWGNQIKNLAIVCDDRYSIDIDLMKSKISTCVIDEVVLICCNITSMSVPLPKVVLVCLPLSYNYESGSLVEFNLVPNKEFQRFSIYSVSGIYDFSGGPFKDLCISYQGYQKENIDEMGIRIGPGFEAGKVQIEMESDIDGFADLEICDLKEPRISSCDFLDIN